LSIVPGKVQRSIVMFKHSKTWEALAIGGVLTVGGVIAGKAIFNATQRRMQRLSEIKEPHAYAVMYSAHGGDFHYLGTGTAPTPPHKTRQEAVAMARRFVATASNIGGKAKVINVNTGEEVPF
jgi:hypothetical protein